MRVIETNMCVAAQIAARYRRRGIPLEDLEQVAYLALVKAVRRYEYAEDRDFLSYAVPTIRGEIRRYFRDLGWAIRPTRRIQEAQTQLRQVEDELMQELGRAPRPSELSERSHLDLDLVIEAFSATGLFTPISLELSMTEQGGQIQDRVGDNDAGFDSAEAKAMLAPLLAHVTPRERTMLDMRFFRGATQKEIGDVLGVTQMQVSRLLSDLMKRLREQLLDANSEPTSVKQAPSPGASVTQARREADDSSPDGQHSHEVTTGR
jgi:RNA polymerase sigma-B factor